MTQKSKELTRIEKIDELIDWNKFGYRLEQVLGRSREGRPPYPAVGMFKIMILQHLYGLSDPEMEEILYDRLSFRRFCGFHLEEVLPD
ncbi:MAG: transposase, partial [Alphaproteobacteria bacterium]|nr:transposase [Alphaproteobacteria bacterium]